MIIRIIGTNGSGKTTLVSRLMQTCKVRDVVDPMVRKKLPIGHVLNERTYVVGYYRDGCIGGCDTAPGVMRKRDAFFENWLPLWQNEHEHVLYEGVVFGDEVTRTVALSRTMRHEILYLTTSADDCVASVRSRRASKGMLEDTFNEKKVRDKHRQMQNVAHRLRDAGMTVHKLDREAALRYLKTELL